jgi:hypothetical protein
LIAVKLTNYICRSMKTRKSHVIKS